ncbi:hypothetical protein KIPE111705_44340 [Kibdelosporangium persicum]|uniref:Uncharacterized protein n=1 Tax=Kibdelosporangium persicum TaxID=2698649 RepID=A0ABX2EZV8_9PSEU|nr:hypothetical protein [Kibdelosporangium persicum]NRN64507.1 hypothetical protein [Kibdelosporangium persicum]
MRTPFVFMAVAAACVLSAAPAAASDYYPHPAPLGPERPYEATVPGPDNFESGTAYVERLGTGISVTFDGHRSTATGEKPAAPREFVFLFDNSIRFDLTAFPTCSREQFAASACPPGSKVGAGHARFYPTGTADVAVYNTKFANGMRGVLITIPATGAVFENTLEPVVGRYQRDYTWGLHEIIQPDNTPPAQRGSTTSFLVTFGATWQGEDFVKSHARPGKELHLGVWSHYVTGQRTLKEGTTVMP